MEAVKTTKFMVIKTDIITHDSIILGNFYGFEMGLGFVNEFISENYPKNSFQRLHETKNSISVYKYGGIWGKSLIAKIQILEYDMI